MQNQPDAEGCRLIMLKRNPLGVGVPARAGQTKTCARNESRARCQCSGEREITHIEVLQNRYDFTGQDPFSGVWLEDIIFLRMAGVGKDWKGSAEHRGEIRGIPLSYREKEAQCKVRPGVVHGGLDPLPRAVCAGEHGDNFG